MFTIAAVSVTSKIRPRGSTPRARRARRAMSSVSRGSRIDLRREVDREVGVGARRAALARAAGSPAARPSGRSPRPGRSARRRRGTCPGGIRSPFVADHPQQQLVARGRGRPCADRRSAGRGGRSGPRRAPRGSARPTSGAPRSALAVGSRVEDGEAVAAGLLGVVHRDVGLDEQLLGASSSIAAGKSAMPIAGGRAPRPFVGRRSRRRRGSPRAAPRATRGRAAVGRVRQDHGELVAADAGEGVALAQAVAQERWPTRRSARRRRRGRACR